MLPGTWISVPCISLTHRKKLTRSSSIQENMIVALGSCLSPPPSTFSDFSRLKHSLTSDRFVCERFRVNSATRGKHPEEQKTRMAKNSPALRSFRQQFNSSNFSVCRLKCIWYSPFLAPTDQCLWAKRSRSRGHRSSSLYLKTGLH